MLMEMAGSRSCGGRAFQDNGLDEEIARVPNVEVDEQFVLIGRTQVCATSDGGERCAAPGEVRRCQTVQAFVGCQAKFKRDTLRIITCVTCDSNRPT